MTGIIIATIGFVLSIIALVIALIAKTKECKRLMASNSHNYFANFKIHPIYERYSQFVKVAGVKQETISKHVKKLEEEGYKYDSDRSFSTILCFTKHVEVKEEPETPSES